MYYVSRINRKKGTFGVTDTEDGVTQYMTREEIMEAVNLGFTIHGVAGNQINVVSLEGQVMRVGFGDIEKQVDELIAGWSVEACMAVGRSGSFVSKLKGKPEDEVRRITKSYVYPDSIREAVKNAAQYTNEFREVDVSNQQAVIDALTHNVCLVLQQKTSGVLTSFVCSGSLDILDKIYTLGFFDSVYLTKQLYSYTYDANKLRPRKDRDIPKKPNMLNVFSCSLRFRNAGVRHDKGNMVISSPFYTLNLEKLFCVYVLDNPIKLGDTLKDEFRRGKHTGIYDFDFEMFKEVIHDVRRGDNSFADPANFLRYLDQSTLPNGVTLKDVMDRYARDWNYMQHLRNTGVSFVIPSGGA